ncbi:Uncharacterised protein [Klebsiella pneumoniae]|uniref:Uncharacterized protein n=1 Tax=Klebsiella pneumoniae TaxID=573 RepID=A0A377ZNW9_KLEPN|nr:Uncharacterised protein [Klebsiella pneumoniae]
MGWFIVVRSKPSRDCPGGIWGWITPSKDDVATGYTITPGKEFNLTMKDMCSPDMKVTFRPNKKDPRYDDLVGIYAGKEAFRYKTNKIIQLFFRYFIVLNNKSFITLFEGNIMRLPYVIFTLAMLASVSTAQAIPNMWTSGFGMA